MKAYAVQLNCRWEKKEANFSRVLRLLDDKRIQPGSLIVLPETFATGFSMNLDKTIPGEPELTKAYLSELSSTLKCWVMGGMVAPAEDSDKGRNLSATFDPEGKEIASYAKIQPATIYQEDEKHQAGKKVEVFSIPGFTVCPLICYDLRFPELFRIGMQKKADLFVVMACWPKVRIEHWITLLRARAIENLSFVLGVNRTGKDPNLEYGGKSLIIDPKGNILADGGEAEGILEADLNACLVKDWRKEFPALIHAKTEFLPPL